MTLGLVSDTHGLVDAKLLPLFRGCARVVHAGDVVKPDILDLLADVAPLTVVRGNNDHGPAFAHLPETALVEAGALRILVVHDLGPRERPKPPARALLPRERPEIVIHGHSHHPGAAVVDGRLYVNPGSAGPRRFRLPRCAALLSIRGRRAEVTFYDLEGDAAHRHGDPFVATL
ncbi:metallophosphoesterase family protein [Anaeromyxobacter oryzae]|uniref:Phosphoesterase n=1 Tax=Anaeromyxobacter oryzae TaxID=2918170 RepID=A0ABN6N352_9BACT|nr:metallophosphoesterase family protein [Anaeromyxobacter oryzae]BDG06359.1 phosphoesterase [Anaeromyxobacter oryzae]